uniref:Uncharacterized protein n=1 Tax=viral metagenome TaxID=1070528 RepID=A0A6C0IX65_9ZZZZ
MTRGGPVQVISLLLSPIVSIKRPGYFERCIQAPKLFHPGASLSEIDDLRRIFLKALLKSELDPRSESGRCRPTGGSE